MVSAKYAASQVLFLSSDGTWYFNKSSQHGEIDRPDLYRVILYDIYPPEFNLFSQIMEAQHKGYVELTYIIWHDFNELDTGKKTQVEDLIEIGPV